MIFRFGQDNALGIALVIINAKTYAKQWAIHKGASVTNHSSKNVAVVFSNELYYSL